MPTQKISGVNELSAAQRELITSYLSAAGLKVVVVGAQLGQQSWDIRPLFLEGSDTCLLRFSDPDIRPGSGHLQRCWLEYHELLKSPGLFGRKIKFGQVGGRFWVLRPYYSETLQDPGLLTQLRSTYGSDPLLRLLLDQLRALSAKGLVHGNLSFSNLAYLDGRIILLDYGLDALTRRQHLSGLPEHQQAVDLDARADIFSFGRLLPQLLGSEALAKHSLLLKSMAAINPLDRPAIDEVSMELFPDMTIERPQRKPRHIISGVSLADDAKVTQGKLIKAASGMQRSRSGSLTNISREEFMSRVLAEERLAAESGVDSDRNSSGNIRRSIAGQSEGRSDSSSTKRTDVVDKSQTLPFALVSLVFLVIAALYGAGVFQPNKQPAQGPSLPFEQYWLSDQPTLMAEVARAAALEGSERARRVILTDLQSGISRSGVNTTLLRAASNRLWYGDFKERDKSLLFRIALIDLVPGALKSAPPLASAHPGLLFGIVVSLPVTQEQGFYSSVDLAKFSSLPSPIGPALVGLQALGSKDLSDPAARALVHLLVANTGPGTLAYLCPESQGLDICAKRLSLVLSVFSRNEQIAQGFLESALRSNSSMKAAINWFDDESLETWKDTPATTRMLLLAGKLPEAQMTFEQYADLLRFPLGTLRQQTGIYLGKNFFKPQDINTLAFLASTANTLSRAQTVFLLSTMRLEGEPAFTFISKWFDTDPDPRSVFGILMARKNIQDFDALNLSAARYIKDKNWEPTFEELVAAVDHPETLVRALVSTKLSASNPQHAELLRRMLSQEPDKNLKAQLEEKLADAGE